MQVNYDYIIIGAGLSGGVLARKLAEEKKKSVLILERRSHLAGNMYDYEDDHKIRVQKYGPHVFHTNSKEIYEYITRFCEPVPYCTKCEAVIGGKNTPSPFNFRTIDQFYSEKQGNILKKKLKIEYQGQESVPVIEMLQSTDSDIRGFAEFLFENDYRPYTAKQWNMQPEEINSSVLKRVPIILSYKDSYFRDKYEFMPKDGFDAFYRTMITYPGIDIELGKDALEMIILDYDNQKVMFDSAPANIIYTGPIDELFDYKYGMLPYRSLYFDFKSFPTSSFQDAAIVAYPKAKGYTRITEYTKMPKQTAGNWTTVAYEFPLKYEKKSMQGNEPYYPVLTEKSGEMYKQYLSEVRKYKNLTLCGRLADFKYYNMDQVIMRALEVYKKLKDN